MEFTNGIGFQNGRPIRPVPSGTPDCANRVSRLAPKRSGQFHISNSKDKFQEDGQGLS
jgi:hypothetical protein